MSVAIEDRRRVTTSPIRAAVALGLVFVLGMVVRSIGAHDSNDGGNGRRVAVARSVESDTSVTAGPRRFTHGVPQGFARSRQGALAAASSYLCTGQTLLDLAPTQVEQAVDLMTAAGSSATQVARTSKQLVDLRAALVDGAGATQYLQAVLATRVDAYTSTRARVSMWNVGVLSRRNSAPPQAGWSITTYDLVWEHDDWKIWSEDTHAGPAPMLNGGAAPATADELAEQLDGFQFAQAPS